MYTVQYYTMAHRRCYIRVYAQTSPLEPPGECVHGIGEPRAKHERCTRRVVITTKRGRERRTAGSGIACRSHIHSVKIHAVVAPRRKRNASPLRVPAALLLFVQEPAERGNVRALEFAVRALCLAAPSLHLGEISLTKRRGQGLAAGSGSENRCTPIRAMQGMHAPRASRWVKRRRTRCTTPSESWLHPEICSLVSASVCSARNCSAMSVILTRFMMYSCWRPGRRAISRTERSVS